MKRTIVIGVIKEMWAYHSTVLENIEPSWVRNIIILFRFLFNILVFICLFLDFFLKDVSSLDDICNHYIYYSIHFFIFLIILSIVMYVENLLIVFFVTISKKGTNQKGQQEMVPFYNKVAEYKKIMGLNYKVRMLTSIITLWKNS